MNKVSIAVLMTCYNRRSETLSCLERLEEQEGLDGVLCRVYLVDDGSTDGTAEAVRKEFPKVIVVEGDGSLFWNGGMRRAWQEALKSEHDYYLWLNDDVVLKPNAIKMLLDTCHLVMSDEGKIGIIAAAMEDPESGELTYGGMLRDRGFITLRFKLLKVAEVIQRCETINGNCVLVPRQVADVVGNFSSKFQHALGDYDYGLRAQKAGFACYIAPGTLGTCPRNSTAGAWFDPDVSLELRKRAMQNPKGRPLNEWLTFVRRHAGSTAIFVAWGKLQLRLLFPGLYRQLRLKRGRSY